MSKLPATISTLTHAIQKTKQSLVLGNSPFLRLLKDGRWYYGQDDIPVADDDIWVANPMSFEKGFVSWGKRPDAGLKGEEMASISDEPVIKTSLPDTGFPWKQQMSVEMVCIEGTHEGDACLYKTSAYGGLKAMDGLLTSLLAQIAETQKTGSDDVVPVIVLAVDSYKHTEHGKTFTPELNVIEWASLSEGIHEKTDDDDNDDEPDTEAEPEPTKRTRTRTAPAKANPKKEAEPEAEIVEETPTELEEVEEVEAPTRRRRRARK